MQITRSSIATGTGSAEWFTGQVYVDTFTSPTHRTGCRPRASTSRRAQRTAQALNARRLATPSLKVCARGL